MQPPSRSSCQDDVFWCILWIPVSSCSREDHLFLRYDLWNVTCRQQYNLTLPLLSYKLDPSIFSMFKNRYSILSSIHELVVFFWACSIQIYPNLSNVSHLFRSLFHHVHWLFMRSYSIVYGVFIFFPYFSVLWRCFPGQLFPSASHEERPRTNRMCPEALPTGPTPFMHLVSTKHYDLSVSIGYRNIYIYIIYYIYNIVGQEKW